MEIRHLRYFCVLAEQLHFTKAALLLNVAQPALSHQIMQLDDELGTQLVDRTTGVSGWLPPGKSSCLERRGFSNELIRP
jgi:DNA-binding transcriptional LysR family regulator